MQVHWILEADASRGLAADHQPVLQHPKLVTSKHSPVTLAMTEKPFQPLK